MKLRTLHEKYRENFSVQRDQMLEYYTDHGGEVSAALNRHAQEHNVYDIILPLDSYERAR